MPEHRLCVIPGDGIGQEVVPIAVEILTALMPDIVVSEAEAGWTVFQRTGTALPLETLDLARKTGTVLFGAVASPSHPVTGYRSPIVALRRELESFCNLRPSRTWPGLAADNRMDLMVVRENTEGLYAGRERMEGDTAITERIISRQGTLRVAQAAFDLAKREGRRVTVVHKANVVRVGDGLWRAVCLEVGELHPEVEVEEGLVDSVAHNLVRQPDRYQLLLAPNLYGDILSDLAAALSGGLGMAPSVSLGHQCVIAEPVHGAAPDIAGKGIANPLGTILSGAMLARYAWDRPDVAAAIEASVADVVADGLHTPDLATSREAVVGTREMGAAILSQLEADVL